MTENENLPAVSPVQREDFQVEQDGRLWMTAQHLGEMLGYGVHRDFLRLIQRHREELEPFKGVVKLTTPFAKGGPQKVTVISEDGCYIVAMLATTDRAKIFRRNLAAFLAAWRRQQFQGAGVKPPPVVLSKEIRQRMRLLGRMQSKAVSRLNEIVGPNDRKDAIFLLRRMNELCRIMPEKEVASLYGIEANTFKEKIRLYREAEGYFEDGDVSLIPSTSFEVI